MTEIVAICTNCCTATKKIYSTCVITSLSVQITNLAEKKVKHQYQSESITLRLDSIILDKLQREAKQTGTSVNALVSQVIRRHVDWHSNAAKAGFVTVRRGLLVNLINRLSEKEITSVAEYTAKKETKDFVLLLRNEYSMESALDVIETWIQISGHPYRHEVNYTTHSYVIQHDMGRNWSLYMAEQYRFLFEHFALKKVDFDMTDSTLDFVVDTEKI